MQSLCYDSTESTIKKDLNHYLTQKLPLANGEKNGKS